MRTIRASEISSFVYCQRAWWYRLQGNEPENQAELAAGSQLHQHHGRQVMAAGLLSGLAWLLLLMALVLLVIYLVGQLL
jgi:CRISPR/Cas system-associated exonuclease Cas4 (RecB family)